MKLLLLSGAIGVCLSIALVIVCALVPGHAEHTNAQPFGAIAPISKRVQALGVTHPLTFTSAFTSYLPIIWRSPLVCTIPPEDATKPGARQLYSFEQIVPCLTTPDLVSQFMLNNLTFMYDEPGHNYPQNADETYERGGGDCEDSAMFAFYILSQNGWSFMGNGWEESGNWVGGFNVQWVETDPRGGHAVCLYKPSGQPLYYIDNNIQQLGIVRGSFATVEEAVADISERSNSEWRWYEFFDLEWNLYGRVYKP